jgi:hypothetical protein
MIGWDGARIRDENGCAAGADVVGGVLFGALPSVYFVARNVYYLPGFWQPGWEKSAVEQPNIFLLVLVFLCAACPTIVRGTTYS